MNLPKNLTEQDVVDIIANVVHRLAQRFRFGYHDIDDMKQQGSLFALEALDKYDGKRPLENFLWTHVRNRLCNYKRDKYERLQIPCFQCDDYDFHESKCLLHRDMLECNLYHNLYIKNMAKKNLMSPIELGQVQSEHESNMSVDNDPHVNAECDELKSLIETNIPLSLRADYLRLKDGIKLPKQRRDNLKAAIKEILINNGYWKE